MSNGEPPRPSVEPTDKIRAQQRADQIAAFRAELDELRREGMVPWPDADLARVAAHQDAVLARFAQQFDIDRTEAARRMSRGMQIASLLGAGALVAAIVSFFYRVWGALGTPAQVALVTAAPVAAVLIMVAAGRIERTRYVASLFAIVACGAFVLQTVVLGQIFNLRATPHVIAAWGLFALAVATPWRFAFPYASGVVALAVYVPALLLWVNGSSWYAVSERPELLGLSAACGVAVVARAPEEVADWSRAVLLVVALGALLVLTYGAGSFLSADRAFVELFYQFVAAAVAIGLIAVGLRRGLDDVVTIGSIFGGLFLLTRFVDWWWDWMPKYLFFLIIAAVALAWIGGLRMARRRLAGGLA
jgi:hypothetical protein